MISKRTLLYTFERETQSARLYRTRLLWADLNDPTDIGRPVYGIDSILTLYSLTLGSRLAAQCPR